MPTIEELRDAYNEAVEELDKRVADIDALADDATEETVTAARDAFTAAKELAAQRRQRYDDAEAAKRAREQHQPLPAGKGDERGLEIRVDEPDMYLRDKGTVLRDLYFSQVRNDPGASERIGKHHRHELSKLTEERAVATGTLGGIIPPQYLVDMYAKASRNGRVFCDQVNRKPLPDEGMSLIVPRLTAGLTAAVQASESTALSTQDPTETDLTVPVRTIGGYSPVSRQTLERASYSEDILFEDLIARYFQALDVDCLNGSGSSGHILGLLQTSGLASSDATSSSPTVLGDVWPKIADVIQQINTNVGGLGFKADKIFMHPRRWGWFTSLLDSAKRPIFGINGLDNYAPAAGGDESGYGLVGRLHGLPVYTDANIPTNLTNDSSSNEDAIIVCASEIVHLWERAEDPVTLSFEQQAGTSLQVQLIAYGYAAFTAGRYPGGSGYVEGSALSTPAFTG